MTNTSDLPSEQTPATVRDFMSAHIAHDADTAASFLTEDVVVVDQGETFRGHDQVHTFLRDAGSEFEYTTEQIGAHRAADTRYVVTVRLRGNFPGGLADLDYRFTLRGDRIAGITIGNHLA
jgi:ketosteroid isomerase-like protein